MKKAVFKYRKAGGIITERVILRPQMLKESTNSLKDFNNPNTNYLHGYEIDRSGMLDTEIAKYERLIEEYFTIAFPTLEAFLATNGLNPNKVQQKTFKKNQIEDPQFL